MVALFRILFAEETFDIKDEVKEFFSENGNDMFDLDTAYDALDGLGKVRSGKYDLVIIDVKIRGEKGFDICRRIRDYCSCPIAFITSLEDDDELMHMYALGADDLVIKPFTPRDVFRLAVEYSGSKRPKADPKLEYGGIRMNQLTGLVTLDGRVMELSDKATAILRILLENKPETVSRDTILNRIWGNKYKGKPRVVDSQIKALRKALGNKSNLIETVKGIGYKIGG